MRRGVHVWEAMAQKEKTTEIVKKAAPPAPAQLMDTLRIDFQHANGQSVSFSEVFHHRLIALYFSASWSPPCKQLTPILQEGYEAIRAAHGKLSFEVILVPRDRVEQDWNKYFNKMPWVSIPFGHKSILELKEQLEVREVPRLIVVTNRGALVSANARGGNGFGFCCNPLAAYQFFCHEAGFPVPRPVQPRDDDEASPKLMAKDSG